MLSAAKLEGLSDFVYACAQSLSKQQTGSASKLNDKFASSAKFQMTYGSLSLFYGGLESLLGPPKMYKGPSSSEPDKSLFNMMEHEHLNGDDATIAFESNSGCKTDAATEWRFCVGPDKSAEYPERAGYKENSPTWCRVPIKLEDMMEAMEKQCNERLRKDGHSELIKEELVAGRLYTGPMVRYANGSRAIDRPTASPADRKGKKVDQGTPSRSDGLARVRSLALRSTSSTTPCFEPRARTHTWSSSHATLRRGTPTRRRSMCARWSANA